MSPEVERWLAAMLQELECTRAEHTISVSVMRQGTTIRVSNLATGRQGTMYLRPDQQPLTLTGPTYSPRRVL